MFSAGCCLLHYKNGLVLGLFFAEIPMLLSDEETVVVFCMGVLIDSVRVALFRNCDILIFRIQARVTRHLTEKDEAQIRDEFGTF